jgi:hypothetical protein
MRLQYQLQPADIEVWWQYQTKRSGAARANLYSTALLMGGVSAVGAALLPMPVGWVVAIGAAGTLVGGILGVLGTRAWVTSFARRAARPMEAQVQFGLHVLDVSPEAVAEEGPAGRHQYPWDAIEGLFEAPGYLFLAVGGGCAYVVPTRDLASSVLEEFRREVHAHREAWLERRRTTK